MSKEDIQRRFVALPCSEEQVWAVPEGCLAEVVSVTLENAALPEEIHWRGGALPVLNLAGQVSDSGNRGDDQLVAVFRGLGDQGCWGVAVKAQGLGLQSIGEDESQPMEDAPESMTERSLAAFRFAGNTYQVPDLQAWQSCLKQAAA